MMACSLGAMKQEVFVQNQIVDHVAYHVLVVSRNDLKVHNTLMNKQHNSTQTNGTVKIAELTIIEANKH